MTQSLRDRRWLELHGGTWRVTVAVPRALQSKLGTRLKKTLLTDSLSVANSRKLKVVHELREIINHELGEAGLRKRSTNAEAMALRDRLKHAYCEFQVEDALSEIADIASEIRGPEVAIRHDPETGVPEYIFDPARDARAEEFVAIVQGAATPFSVHHGAYLLTLKVARRTRADDVRAIKYLADWCIKKGWPAAIETITGKKAVLFMDEFAEFSGGLHPATLNKYLNRLSRFWQYLRLRVDSVEINPWSGLSIKAEQKASSKVERPFTDTEVRALLMGGAPPKLLDVMLIGALTGARLDAIVDLKVKDTMDGAFTFKRQKRETSARDVPIHRDLVALVERRTAGKAPDDDLFPEWPRPRKAGSNRERSFKYSNCFTEYRRKCGVDETLPGVRRSLVNFHSFRRWFCTKAERAGTDGDLIAAIIGHKRAGMTLGRYSAGPKWRQACKGVNAVKLPPLDDSPIKEDRGLRSRNV